MKIAAIVPALNEEKNIANVLNILLNSKYLNEVILVDDNSTDRTAQIGKEMGAKVLQLTKDQARGKGFAMAHGLKSTDAQIIIFFDADLIGLSEDHIGLLLTPILKEEAVMVVGIRERGGWKGKVAEFFIKFDPLLAIAGERALKRDIFEKIPQKFIQGFMVETALNYYCLVKKIPVKYVVLKNLDIVVKEKKWGFLKGFWARLKMILELLKIRILIFLNRKEFL